MPRAVREALHLHAGQPFQVVVYEDRIELIPQWAMSEMRGFLKGIDTEVRREDGGIAD
ncbi:AbrB/MazE/SpoVT family DNA-binding domain-containing protein [Thiohalospira halophila]|uniref:AbrB/MazE/SpoVT family DNA-binding domain-containing protein n=1 Tax=Thiohalospira halophila TaxID=381300 RepID=UPI000B80AC75|nr:AbrB/MazE/SpoVT family DNA-binding domain-containing protein [Thiohalospira halophila]